MSSRLGLGLSLLLSPLIVLPPWKIQFLFSKPAPDPEWGVRMQASVSVSEMHHTLFSRHYFPSPLRLSFPPLIPRSPSWPLSVTALGAAFISIHLFISLPICQRLSRHNSALSQGSLRGSCKRLGWKWQTAFMFSCGASATTDAVACASVLHNLPPIWETWQPPASLSLWLPFNFRRSCSLFFSLPPPHWAHKGFMHRRKKRTSNLGRLTKNPSLHH